MDALRALLAVDPIKKPSKHQGDESTDYFDVRVLPPAILRMIGLHLFTAEADAVSPTGETTPEASRNAGMVDIWSATTSRGPDTPNKSE